MKKALSVSLAGMLFAIDEDAYEKLDTYLVHINRHFAKSPDKDEIIRDIEASIAEKFSSSLKSGRTVVNIETVDGVIADLGTVAQMAEDDDAAETKEILSVPTPPKTFYRDNDTKVLAGVCAGLAHYFGINVVWVRLIAIVLLFTPINVFVVIGYIVTALSVSYARTPVERMRMTGDQLTLSSIEQSVKERVDETRVQNESALMRLLTLPFKALAVVFRTIERSFPFLLSLGAAFAVFVITMMIIGSTVAAGTLLFVPESQYVSKPLPDFPANNLEVWMVVLGYIAVLLPLIYAVILCISIIKRKYILNTVSSISLLFIWIIVGVGAFLVSVNAAPGLQARADEYLPTERSIEVGDFRNVEVRGAGSIRLVEGTSYGFTVQGTEQAVNRVRAENRNGTLVIWQEMPEICLFCFRHGSVEMVLSAPDIAEIDVRGALGAVLESFDADDTLKLRVQGASKVELQNAVLSVVTLDVHGASRVTLSGEADDLTADIAGASRVLADRMRTQHADVQIAGASQAEVWVDQTLKVDVKGASRVSYRGTPEVEETVDDAGKLNRIESNRIPLPVEPTMPEGEF